MPLMQISGPCLEATRLLLNGSFNALVAAHYSEFGLTKAVDTIDFTPDASVQYIQANATPDDVMESTPFKFPAAFHFTDVSNNAHMDLGVAFSGPVQQTLTFWYTDKSDKLSRKLEKIGNLVEAVVNTLMADGNWPSQHGANAVCGVYPMTRGKVLPEGEGWMQGFTFRLVFTVVAD